jgi:Flp pilus assembly pilin Flp
MIAAQRLRRLARAVKADERGASFVEFTLIAPFLGLLTVGIADYSRGFSERFTLENAAHRTLERAGVGSTKDDYSFLKQEAANAAGVPIENVTLDNWLECGGTRMPNYSDPCEAGQQGARYIYIKIQKAYQLSMSLPGQSSTMLLSGDAAVRVQ